MDDNVPPILQLFGPIVHVSIGDDPSFPMMLVQERNNEQRWWLLYMFSGGIWDLFHAFHLLNPRLWPQLTALEGQIVDVAV